MVEVGWSEPVHGIVDHIGLFSTRLRDASSTMHFPNHVLSHLRNLSQEATTTTLRLSVAGNPDADDVAEAIRGLAGSSELTDVIFLGDIAAYEPHTGQVAVDVRTLRPLDGHEAGLLEERAQRVLDRAPAAIAADQTAAARSAAARSRRMTRRSSSDSPPQIPES